MNDAIDDLKPYKFFGLSMLQLMALIVVASLVVTYLLSYLG